MSSRPHIAKPVNSTRNLLTVSATPVNNKKKTNFGTAKGKTSTSRNPSLGSTAQKVPNDSRRNIHKLMVTPDMHVETPS